MGKEPRIPLEEVYMRMAEELAKRSTCDRRQVGTVLTTPDLTRVLGIGYNGNARGFANKCDVPEQSGGCGCIHSEANALIKAGSGVDDKIVFVTLSPCVMCSKMIVNSGASKVFYRNAYRDPAGIDLMKNAGIEVELYDKYRGLWRA